MTGKTKKIIFFSVLGLVAIAAVVGYYMYNKGPVCVDCSGGKKITAADLYQSFSKDSINARKTYAGIILEVSGRVTKVTLNPQNPSIVLLKTNESGASLNCTMEGPLGNIKAEDSITIKGICTGMGAGVPELNIAGDVYLTRCYISK